MTFPVNDEKARSQDGMTEVIAVRKSTHALGTECEALAKKLEKCGLAGIAHDLLRVGHELQDGIWDRVAFRYLAKEG